jgi:hypothetical protein
VELKELSHCKGHTSSISCRCIAGAMMPDYALNGEPKDQRIPNLRTACNRGCIRPWCACSHCRSCLAVLYLRRGGFYCRTCAQVADDSQSEDACGRSWIKQGKAEAKLGEDWARPRGRLKATCDRLPETICQCGEKRDEAQLAAYCERASCCSGGRAVRSMRAAAD